MIVCPAGLTVKWHDEMAEKFGLDFTSSTPSGARQVRRDLRQRGEPVRVYPLTIVSLPWLRGPKAQRLLDEVLPADADRRRARFDLLILDEAHHVAPAAPQAGLRRRLAADQARSAGSRRTSSTGCSCRRPRTTATRSRSPRCWRSSTTSASPAASTRTARPSSETVVRRLKRDIVNADGTPRFVERRHVDRSPSTTPTSEREVHAPARRVRRAAPRAAHRPPARPQGRRPGHAAAQEAAVLQPGRVRAHRRRLPRDPATASGRRRARQRRRGRRVARRVLRRRRRPSTTSSSPRPRTTPSTGPPACSRRRRRRRRRSTCCDRWRTGRSRTRPGPTRRPAS